MAQEAQRLRRRALLQILLLVLWGIKKCLTTRRAACQVLVIYSWFWVNCSHTHNFSCPSHQSDQQRRSFQNRMKTQATRLFPETRTRVRPDETGTQASPPYVLSSRKPRFSVLPSGSSGSRARGPRTEKSIYILPYSKTPLQAGTERLCPFPLPSLAPAQQAMQTPQSSADKPPTFF